MIRDWNKFELTLIRLLFIIATRNMGYSFKNRLPYLHRLEKELWNDD